MEEKKTQRVEYNITVKFHDKMEPIVPVINFGTVMDICAVMNCDSVSDVYEEINKCYGTVTVGEKEGTGIKNQARFSEIAIIALDCATKSAYDDAGKTVDFTKANIKKKLSFKLAFHIVNWLTIELVNAITLENPDPNGIQIEQRT